MNRRSFLFLTGPAVGLVPGRFPALSQGHTSRLPDWFLENRVQAHMEHGIDCFEIAPGIRQPTWLGWGDQDDGANMGEGVARLSRLLPRCELRVFPGARHSLAAEIPGPLAEALAEFLGRGEGGLP